MLLIDSLCKAYGKRVVLDHLNLNLPTGELYGLLGSNGAGKTTLINILCRLLNADQGTIVLNDVPLARIPKRWIGVAPQANLLYQSLTCAEHLNFFARLYGLPPRGLRDRVRHCLDLVGLADRSSSLAETLSGGMQRRLSLAIALIHGPKLLILDEPTTGLDVESRHDLWSLISKLRQQGLTILLTTHLLDEAEKLCQRIGILDRGKIIAEGSMEDLRPTIAACELLVIQTEQEQQCVARASQLGWTHRYYAGELTLWLPEPHSLAAIVQLFEGIPLQAIARQPIRLEHLYLEITQTGRLEAS